MHGFHHWRVRIDDARDERAIDHVITDYRLTLPPAIVESLPAECRQAISAKDIPGAALTLLQAEVKYRGAPEIGATLCEVAQTYAAAAVKVAAWRSGR